MPNPWLPKRLSVSAVEKYCRCPADYKRRYVDGVIDPPTGAMAFGRAMASALEALHRGQDAEVAFVRSYDAEILQPQLRGAAPLQHGLALLKRYQAHGVGVGEPEFKFSVYLPDREAVPVEILGYMDLATPTEILEFKTSAAAWDQGRVDGSAQAALYRYAYWQVFGRKPECVRFIVLHTRRVELTEFRAYPAGPELRLFELQAAATWRGIRDAQFPPRCGKCAACGDAPPTSQYPRLEWR